MVCDDHLRDRRHDGHSRQFYGERRISGYYGGFRNRARSGATPIHRLLWCHDRRHAAFGLGDPEFRTARRIYRCLTAFPLRLGDEWSRHEYDFALVRSRLPRNRRGHRSTTGDGGDIFGLARAVQRHVDGALQHGHGIGANYGPNARRSRARVFQLALRLPAADSDRRDRAGDGHLVHAQQRAAEETAEVRFHRTAAYVDRPRLTSTFIQLWSTSRLGVGYHHHRIYIGHRIVRRLRIAPDLWPASPGEYEVISRTAL